MENENEIVDWLQCDGGEIGYQLLTDDKIIDIANEDETVDYETDTEAEYDGGDAPEDTGGTAKDFRNEAKQAASHIQNYIDWYCSLEDANHTDAMILRRLRAFAFQKAEALIKQTKITDFVTKQSD